MTPPVGAGPRAAAETSPPAAGSKTLDNGIRLLKEVARTPGGLTVTELARAVGVHRTVAYRLLGTLSAHGLVSQSADGRYEMGLGALGLFGAVRPALQELARPELRSLVEHTGATAFVAVLDGDEAVSVAVVEPVRSQAHVAYPVGLRHRVDRGAGGLAILGARAPQPDERVEISRARELGYATSYGELENGIWGLASAIPVTGAAPESAIGVVALGPLDEPRTAELVLAAAATISRRLS
ncbi:MULTISPECIES: IclR family transcriptional regulator [unclassified Crossiella]|uniref:IclR family transcriptional regulator n=1 Tax=unclassified Crossiella TaxID=2620835 RepID=UPI001FFF23C3|nr:MULTISPECIES: helix-turn-helix domain-containing protein [unclassified Crossiella]MCK2244619.1 helix-turn-helix domain-containing protein [Crossiella sp. S99.2]MCK2258394.1 helix-turn-helix domain-containing protein [Crossiella sp. S99.1]